MTDDTPTIAAVRAALETAHWYSVDRTGRATQCVDAQDAHDNAACNARDWPAVAPHRAMQLIDAAPVAAMLAELDRLRDCLATANSQTEHFERQWYLRGDALEEMQAERDRLAAEVAGRREDAERYRWLRAQVSGHRNPDSGRPAQFAFPGVMTLPPLADIMRGSVSQHLDAAIDAARTATAKEPT